MSKLNFDEFKQAVAENIRDYLPEKYEDSSIDMKQVVKNNDTVLDAIVIKTQDSNIAPSIYLNSFYDEYQNGKDLDTVIGNIADVQIEHEVGKNVDVNIFTDFDNVKDKIVPKLINAESNEKLLEERPHELMDDLAVTYEISVEESEYGRFSIAITDALMDAMGVTKEQLHDTAIENLDKNMTPTLENLQDVVKEMMVPDIMVMMDVDKETAFSMVDDMAPSAEVPMYVLSNEQRLNGAAVVLNDKVMEDVAKQVGDDFFVLPSSLHELLIVPKNEDVKIADLEAIVQEVNATQVSPEERLSDHVYEYDAKEKELFRADRAEEHEQKVEKKHEKEASKEKKHERVSVKEKIPEMKSKMQKTDKEHENVDKKRDMVME